MRSCVCTLVGTKACESCAYNGRNMLIDSIKSVYSPEIKTKSVTTEVKIMDRILHSIPRTADRTR